MPNCPSGTDLAPFGRKGIDGKPVVTSENDDKDRWTEAFTRITGDHAQRSRVLTRCGRLTEPLPREDDTCVSPSAIGRFRRLGKLEHLES